MLDIGFVRQESKYLDPPEYEDRDYGEELFCEQADLDFDSRRDDVIDGRD